MPSNLCDGISEIRAKATPQTSCNVFPKAPTPKSNFQLSVFYFPLDFGGQTANPEPETTTAPKLLPSPSSKKKKNKQGCPPQGFVKLCWKATLQGFSDIVVQTTPVDPGKVKRLFQTIDSSGDGTISLDEFERLVQSPKLQFWMSQLESLDFEKPRGRTVSPVQVLSWREIGPRLVAAVDGCEIRFAAHWNHLRMQRFVVFPRES